MCIRDRLRLAKQHAEKVGLSFHVGSQCMHPISYAKGISEIGNIIKKTKITPDYIKDFALSIDQKEAEVIFLSCSGIRSLDIIEEVEATTGKPVITSNQAQMWYALRTAGVNDKLSGFGIIFKIIRVCTM